MNVPEDRLYTEDHEWAQIADRVVRIGITDYAQDALGDVVFVDLPKSGGTVAVGDTLAEVESTKSVAEVYAPVAGTITSVNDALADEPELVNSDPYGAGWFVEITVESTEDIDGLLDAATYRDLTD